jgi:hypothetical protein
MGSARIAVREVLQLAGLLACMALATSRLGLLAHELVGHGGTALAMGAHVTDVRLFWFAGGWIRYDGVTTVPAALAIAMGGIAVELVCGTAMALLARGDSLGRRLVRGAGAALVLHGSWYLATGAWHGYGDGVLLARELGAVRYPVAIAAGLVMCAAGFAGARAVFGALRATVPGLPALAVALVLAAGVNVALAVGEVWLRTDPTYVEIMKPEKERLVERDLARWAEYQRMHGGDLSQDAQRVERTRLEREHRTFPFAWILGVCAAVAAVVGAVRARPAGDARITRRLLAIAAAIALISVGAVIAIDLVAR